MRKPAVLALVLAALAGCSGGQHAASKPAALEPPVVVPATVGELLAHVREQGRPVVLNVWATWCMPCREELPTVLAAAQRHRDVRLMLVSTDFDQQLPQVGRFLATQGVSDTSYHKTGPDQAFIDGLNPKWSGALPATFVYDATGKQVAWWEGVADSARLEDAISQAVGARH